MTMRTSTGTATIAGHTVQFTPLHRDTNPTRPVLTVGMWFPVSVEDLAAALWVLVSTFGNPLADLLDPTQLHSDIVSTLFNQNREVEDARAEIAEITPDSAAWPLLCEVREIVDLFYSGPARPGRRLVGVAAR